HPYSIALADFDGDGHIDIAVANYFGFTVSVLRNRGNGTFEPAVDYLVGLAPRRVIAADLNGDGRIDLVTANGSYDASILINRGNGTFEDERVIDDIYRPTCIAAADFDGNGIIDLAFGSEYSYYFSICLGLGGGAFAPPEYHQLPWYEQFDLRAM